MSEQTVKSFSSKKKIFLMDWGDGHGFEKWILGVWPRIRLT
jgi:hypothetical protein